MVIYADSPEAKNIKIRVFEQNNIGIFTLQAGNSLNDLELYADTQPMPLDIDGNMK